MLTHLKNIFFIVGLVLLLNPSFVWAADVTLTAASCSHADITAKISEANISDTTIINVPAGECTWTSTLALPTGKTIKLIGASPSTCGTDGSTCTTIINSAIAHVTSKATGNRISGFRFNRTAGGNATTIITITKTGWRIDNNYFDDADYAITLHFVDGVSATALNETVLPEGLVDSNYFNHTKCTSTGSSVFAKDNGFYAEASAVGTENQVYIENNIFDRGEIGSVSLDTNYAGSYVARYNKLIYVAALAHSLQANTARGTKSVEIYNNDWYGLSNGTGTTYGQAVKLRGGTGMVFNNKWTSSNAPTIVLDTERIVRTDFAANPSCGKCDGSSRWDGNTALYSAGTHTGADSTTTLTLASDTFTASALVGYTVTNETLGGLASGYYCIITSNGTKTVVCSGGLLGSSAKWTEGDAYKVSNGYPCRDQIGRGIDSETFNNTTYPGTQALEPTYFWNNVRSTGSVLAFYIPSPQETWIAANRDYYNYTATFNGTSGVGSGLVADRPATCTTGVGYYATDENKLYKCSAPDTWGASYTPYTCPHPLAGSGSCDYTKYGTTGYTLGGESDVTAPTISTVYVNADTMTINFSEEITAASGAAFTLDPSGADVTVTCPAITTAASSMTCTISRALTAAETVKYAYSGTKVVDTAETPNALAEISATDITGNQTPAEAPTKKLTITKTGSGCIVTSSPSGMNCGSTCEFDYTTATSVTLGNYFVNEAWNAVTYSGGCAGGTADMTNDVANCVVTCTPIGLLN